MRRGNCGSSTKKGVDLRTCAHLVAVPLADLLHWSIDQCEYAPDIVFRRQANLGAIYGNLRRTAIHSVKPDNIAPFLGKKLTGNYQDEIGR